MVLLEVRLVSSERVALVLEVLRRQVLRHLRRLLLVEVERLVGFFGYLRAAVQPAGLLQALVRPAVLKYVLETFG